MLPGVLGNTERATICKGVLNAGYCCNGSVFQKEHSNDFSPANLICCEGDPDQQIATGPQAPTSCTAGNEIPSTKVSNGDSSQPTGSTTTGSSTDNSAVATTTANAGARVIMTDVPKVAALAVLGGVVLGF